MCWKAPMRSIALQWSSFLKRRQWNKCRIAMILSISSLIVAIYLFSYSVSSYPLSWKKKTKKEDAIKKRVSSRDPTVEPRMNYNFLSGFVHKCDVVYWFAKVFSIQSMYLIRLGLEFCNALCDMCTMEFRTSHHKTTQKVVGPKS